MLDKRTLPKTHTLIEENNAWQIHGYQKTSGHRQKVDTQSNSILLYCLCYTNTTHSCIQHIDKHILDIIQTEMIPITQTSIHRARQVPHSLMSGTYNFKWQCKCILTNMNGIRRFRNLMPEYFPKLPLAFIVQSVCYLPLSLSLHTHTHTYSRMCILLPFTSPLSLLIDLGSEQ